MELSLSVKIHFQVPFQFKVACATAGALCVSVVGMKVFMRMNEARTYIISFLFFLRLSSVLWREHHLLLRFVKQPIWWPR